MLSLPGLCLPSLTSSQSAGFTNAYGATARTSFKLFDGKQRRKLWKRLNMNVGLDRSYFYILRWGRLVHYQLMSTEYFS